jgi:hypothetical protein
MVYDAGGWGHPPHQFNHVFADHVGVSIPARVAEAEWQAFASIFFYLSR